MNTKFSLAKYIFTVVSMSIQNSLYILEDVSLSTIYLYFILQEVKERGKHYTSFDQWASSIPDTITIFQGGSSMWSKGNLLSWRS
jgi:hypothetical protein